jgi:hypothetical protein
LIVELCQRFYEHDDATVLPRSVGFKAFENAIALDIAMGGSTNTILHILAIAQEAGINFTMADIDRLSRRGAAAVQGGAKFTQKCTILKTCTEPVASWPFWVNWTVLASCIPMCRPYMQKP